MRKKLLGGLVLCICLFFCGQFIMKQVQAEQVVCDINGTDLLDDTVAIQNYLNLAKDQGAANLYIPSGKYYISRTLTIYSNTTLTLAADAEIIRTDEQHIMIRSEQDYDIGGYGQFRNITIKGGIWNGNVQDSTVLCPLMYFDHGTELTLKDFAIKSCCSRHFVILAGIDTATVSGVKFSDAVLYTGDDVNHEYFTESAEDGTIDTDLSFRTMEALHLDCISADGASEALAYPLDNTVNKNITVEKCTFDGLFSGVGSHYYEDRNVKGLNLKIKNNTFKNMKYTCVDLYNQTSAEVSGNKANKVGELVRSVNSTLKIENNTVVCDPERLVATVELCGIKITDSDSAVIAGNTITGGTHGISLTASSGSISCNTVKNSAGNGITTIDHSTIDFEDNIISSVGISGIYAEQASGEIAGNTVSDCGNHGIAVYEAQYTIHENVVSGAVVYGICVNQSEATVEDNEVKNITEHGIYALDGSNVTIQNNTVNNVGGNGIYTYQSFGNILHNEITTATLNGVLVYDVINTSSKKGLIEDNKVNQTTGNGVRVEEASYVEVTTNTVKGALMPGVHLYNTQNILISGNALTENAQEGVYIYNTDTATVRNNTISCVFDPTKLDPEDEEKSNHNGVAVYDSTSIEIKENVINKSENGILLNASGASVHDNEISNTALRGMWLLEKSNATITKNQFTTIGSHGIHLVDAKATITENTMQGLGQTGIFVFGVTNTSNGAMTITSNKITNPTEHGIRVEDSAYVNVTSNEVTGAVKQSIHVYQSNSVPVLNNILQKNGAEGVYVFASDSVRVEGNTLTQEAGNGIAVYSTPHGSVKNNSITGGENGVLLNDSVAEISGNDIQNVTVRGIWVLGNASSTIKENTINTTGSHGVHLVGAKANIMNNIFSGIGESAILVYGVSNSANSKLSISDNVIEAPADHGIRVEEATYVDVIKNDITNARKQSIHVFSSNNVTITENKLKHNQAEGIYAHTVDTLRVEQNNLTQDSGNGIAVYDANNATVLSNKIDGADNGILLNNAKVEVKSNTITNAVVRGVWVLENAVATVTQNALTTVGTNGIHVVGARADIKDNVLNGIGQTGILVFSSSNTKDKESVVSGNTITNPGYHGIRVEDSEYVNVTKNTVDTACKQSLHVYQSKNTKLTENTLKTNQAEGIYVYNSENITAQNNTLTQQKSNAIAVYGTKKLTVKGNTLSGGDNGILVNASSGEISGNKVNNVASRGIWLLENANANVTGNEINTVGLHGIHLNGAKGTVTNNILKGISKSGILVYASVNTKDATTIIKENTVTKPGEQGIRVENSEYVTVSKNTVDTATKQSLHVLQSKNTSLTDNILKSNNAEGIYIYNSESVTAENNTLTQVEGNAIAIYGTTKASVKKNTLSGGDNGILVNGGQAELSNNKIDNVSARGVWVLEKASAVVTANELTGIGSHGVHVMNASATITNNILKEIPQTGIFVYGSVNTAAAISNISGNVITKPGENGIRVENSEYVTVAKNEVDTAGKQSLQIVVSKNVNLNENTLKKNQAEGIYIYNCTNAVADGNTLTQEKGNTVAVYGTANVSIKNNILTNGDNGVLVNASTGEVSGNKISNVTSRGIWLLENSNAAITGNEISATGLHGIHLNASKGSVQNNKVQNSAKAGVLVFGSVNTQNAIAMVSGNTIADSGEQGIRIENSEYVTVDQNNVDRATKQSMHALQSKNVVFSNNVLNDNNAEGIYIYNSEAITASGNSLKQLAGNAIATYGTTAAVIKDNTITGGDNGILYNASTGEMSGNKIQSVATRGIWILENANAIVSTNEVITAGSHGIHMNGSVGTISNNTLQGIGGSGILVYGSVNTAETKTVVNGNVVNSPAEHGVRIEASEYVIATGNTVTGATKQSMHVFQSKNVAVNGNQMLQNHAEGLYVHSSENVNAEGNTLISDSIQEVLEAFDVDVLQAGEVANALAVYETTNITLKSNSLIGGDNGILFNASAGNISANTIQNMSSRGIWLLTGSTADIADNKIDTVGSFGIHVAETKANIKSNQVENAAKTGINLYKVVASAEEPVLVANNFVTNGSEKGIQLEGCEVVVLEANEVSKNAEQGIRLLNGCKNIDIKSNVIKNNVQHGLLVDKCNDIKVNGNTVTDNKKIDISLIDSTGNGQDNVVTESGIYISDKNQFPVEYTEVEASDPEVDPDPEPDPNPEPDPEPEPDPVSVVDLFDDVNVGDWFVNAVQFAYDTGFMVGKTEHGFEPNGQLTRAQFATVLYSLEGKPAVEYAPTFTDVPAGQWYTKPVLWAYNNNVASGYGTTFGANDNIKREQLAVMLFAYAKMKNYDLTAQDGIIDSFADTEEVSSWAKNALNWAVTQGVMSGKGTKLDPKGNATRAECAAMVRKLLMAQE